MRLSLALGLAMLIGRTTVYLLTHSAAIFSDAAESVVHVIAVGFASFSLRLSTRSASPQFLYGYERITFFSAGFEGAMIVMAAIAILYESIRKWIAGLQLEHLGAGALLILIAGLVNAGLGYHLVRTGRRTNSLILEADGKHVLTDSWTSFGVVGGLGPVLLTRWKPFDSLVAIAVADWAFRRDFETNGPSLYRLCQTMLQGWQRYKDYPDSRVGERFAREVKKLSSAYNAALWVMEREFKQVNRGVSEQIHKLRREVEKEFPYVARLTAATLGPILLWSTLREEKRLASGHTYEPPTFIERRNWVAASSML